MFHYHSPQNISQTRQVCFFPFYPNPFNPSTTITFSLPETGRAELAVYSLTGQKIRTLLSGQMRAGTRAVGWDGCDNSGLPVSSGVYYSRLKMGERVATGRMTLVK